MLYSKKMKTATDLDFTNGKRESRNTKMKFDMHCHTKEGSLDAKVPIEEYIEMLKEQGYGGMLVSDHNSYNGYRKWKYTIKGKKHEDFIVLKGIEYDTIDAGHILVIMPEGVKLPILELRGLPVKMLIDIVHRYGGILGPAHPCGERYLSIVKTWKRKNQEEVMGNFDFLEEFNSCEDEESNAGASMLAQKYDLPGFGGSDSHRTNCIGTAYTELPETIEKESDLIAYLKEGGEVSCGGTLYHGTAREKLGIVHKLVILSFLFYNVIGGAYRWRRRNGELKKKELRKIELKA